MSPVLVLDATWQPTRVVSYQRACVLLVAGRAVPACTVPVAVFRSPSLEVVVPAVVRLSQVVTWRRWSGPPPCSRRGVLVRDEHRCQFVVGGRPCPRPAGTVDHLLPQSRGGADTWENLVAACATHNAAKDDRTLAEMHQQHGWALRRDPRAPAAALRLLHAAGVREAPEAWKPFLPVAATG